MVRGLTFLALLLAPVAAIAGPPAAEYPRIMRDWQAHDARLLSIGWRLARANAPLCRRTQSAIGLMLTDAGLYEEPALARAGLGIAGDIAVEAAAIGSPAEAAGLRAGDEVLAIGGEKVAAADRKTARNGQRLDALHDRIDMLLARNGSVSLTIARSGSPAREVTISGEPACRSRFALQRWGTSASADGLRVQIAVQLMAEHASDDEAATMIAHELAHNVLAHPQANEQAGRNYIVMRRNEREADRMAPWLMANAGYDPAAGPRFMASWGKRHSGGITRAPTHDSYRDRVEAIAAELPAIAAARAAHPDRLADWRARFPGQSAN